MCRRGVLLLAYIDTEMGKTYGGAKVKKKGLSWLKIALENTQPLTLFLFSRVAKIFFACHVVQTFSSLSAFPLFRFPPRASSDNRKAPKLISKVHSVLSFYLSRSGLSFHFGRPSLHRLVFLFFFSSSVFQLVERKLNF